MWPQAAGAAPIRVPGVPAQCAAVTFSAQESTCHDGGCSLSGAAHLACESLRLWADDLEIRWTEEGAFAGAEARGDVLVVDGRTVLRCDRVVLGPDRIRGRVEGATVEIKERPRLDARGVPQGKSASILRGDIERPDADHLVVHDGSFTLCDCGDDPPSWEIGASEIEVELDERAVLWWPSIRVSPFGLGPLPVTPPLLPVSVPLKPRAWGLLPPDIAFFGPYPMIDLPLFVPIGDAWDVTVSAGLRTDWIRRNQLSAPRAGGRLRWAPVEGVQGALAVQWTRDHNHAVAHGFRQSLPPAERDLPRNVERFEALRGLENRVTLTFDQDVRLPFDARWLTNVEWLSDDRIPLDFGVSLLEQVVDYVPSRSQILWAPRGGPVPLAASLGVDHLLRLRTGPLDLKNTEGPELHQPHRGPAARLVLLPFAPLPDVAPGLSIDAELAGAHWSSWDVTDPPLRTSGVLSVGVAHRTKLGPVATAARVAGHGILTHAGAGGAAGAPADPGPLGTSGSAFALVDIGAEVPLARRYGSWIHTITPAVAYRAIPAQRRWAPALWEAGRTGPDERLDAATFHQVEVAVDQALWSSAGARRVARLELRAPFDLGRQRALGITGRVGWQIRGITDGEGWLVVDPTRPEEPLQELGVAARAIVGPMTLGATYLRFAPSAERFHRSLYALAGYTDEPIDVRDWVHSIQPAVTLRSERGRLSYAAIVLLPRPGEEDVDPPRPSVSRHDLGAGYVSACDCWEIGVRASIPGTGTAAEIGEGLRLQITLDIGGYRIGNRP